MEEEIEQVRLLIGDVTEPYTFTDTQITQFLVLAGDNPKRAAALAIRGIARTMALQQAGSVRTDDLTVNVGANIAALYREAEVLEEQADAEDDAEMSDAFEIVYPQPQPDYLEYEERVRYPRPWR